MVAIHLTQLSSRKNLFVSFNSLLTGISGTRKLFPRTKQVLREELNIWICISYRNEGGNQVSNGLIAYDTVNV